MKIEQAEQRILDQRQRSGVRSILSGIVGFGTGISAVFR